MYYSLKVLMELHSISYHKGKKSIKEGVVNFNSLTGIARNSAVLVLSHFFLIQSNFSFGGCRWPIAPPQEPYSQSTLTDVIFGYFLLSNTHNFVI
jgi:hypothetical protein